MKFLTTLHWPLRVWQVTALAPFEVINKSLLPVKIVRLQYYPGSVLLIHFIILILAIIFNKHFIDWEKHVITSYDDFLSMVVVRITTCVIVAESILNRNKQTEFLEHIIRVDIILRRKLQIELDYKKEQFQNNISTLIWILICISCMICVYLVLRTANLATTEFWLLYTIAFFVYSIHYHRMILFVHLILRRYKNVNQFIKDVCSREAKKAENLELQLSLKDQPKVTFANDPVAQPISTSQLADIRNVYQMLYETTNMINDMFWWSLPLCIVIDFHRLLLNFYYIFAVLLLNTDWNVLILAIFWGSVNLCHLILISHACHSTNKEVSLI